MVIAKGELGEVVELLIGSEANARRLVSALKIPAFSVSLGAVESIISYPPKMSHAELNQTELDKTGISPGLLRFSVGLEDVADLISDLDAGLATI